jgi:hypothetical protein
MPSRQERIELKQRLLDQRDPEYATKLAGAFTSHLAAAIQATSESERRRALEKALEAYEDALDGALYEVLDERFAAEDLALS